MRLRLPSAAAAVLAVLALLPAGASAAGLDTVLHAPAAHVRTCQDQVVGSSDSVAATDYTAPATGLLTVRTAGGGDYDVAALGQRSGRVAAAAAGPDSDEIAQGFVAKGERLRIQLCHFGGPASAVRVQATTQAIRKGRWTGKVQVVRVDAPTLAQRDRLLAMGFDPAEGADEGHIDLVLYGHADVRKLRRAGFTWQTLVADAAKLERLNARKDAQFAGRTQVSALPSGRTTYRHLADYEAEMKTLAQQNPGLVKLITLPTKSLEGRPLMGVEITQDVNVDDGKPVFLQIGEHHAREWPSSEHVMEWVYELVKGYGKDERVTRLVNATRTIAVPIQNPDGFNLSREASGTDPGNAAAAVDLPPEIDSQLPISDPTYTAVLLGDQTVGTFSYKRRNCRVKDGEVPKQGDCENSDNRTLGTDTNRNYGALWGGGGASTDTGSDTYRGAGPFSEPENQAIKALVSANQVTTLITNHTFSGLVLRPPGVRSQGLTVDEPIFKALGDAMAAQNGYTSQPGWALYDTTGTTEDWSYNATAGLGYTFEIGKDEFHPPYNEVVDEYQGAGALAGKGNRAAYFLALENTADASKHGVFEGNAPPGTVLRVHKEFNTETSPVVDADGKPGAVQRFRDVLDDTIDVGPSGHFAWHVNPSTRPGLLKERFRSDPADKPLTSTNISSPTPVPPGAPRDIPFDVPAGADRMIKAAITSAGPDYDIYLYEGTEARADKQVGSSAGGTGNETIIYDYPKPGKYVLRVVNFSAVAPYDGSIEVYGSKPGSEQRFPIVKESYTLTCETPTGQVLTTNPLEVDRGATVSFDPCSQNLGPGFVADGIPQGGLSGQRGGQNRNRLGFKIAVDQRRLSLALRLGQRARVRCAIACRVGVAFLLDNRTARRLKLTKSPKKSVIVARGTLVRKTGTPRATFQVRYTKAAKRRLRRLRTVQLTLLAQAVSEDKVLKETARRRLQTLRR
jgi:hypothetical protein